MWCVPKLNEEYIERMEDILDLYAMPYNPREPILCFDEKSKQLLEDTRQTPQTKPWKARRRDYEYKRNGTRNIFMTVEPKGGYREVMVTKRRTREEFAQEVKRIVELPRYQSVERIHIVLDNLNTHSAASFLETFDKKTAQRILKRLVFHYTPAHASWLNMAEIELSIMGRQCLNQRIPGEPSLKHHLRTWQTRRNKHRMRIHWKFTKENARATFKYEPDKNRLK